MITFRLLERMIFGIMNFQARLTILHYIFFLHVKHLAGSALRFFDLYYMLVYRDPERTVSSTFFHLNPHDSQI
jgi:hypothetical protein